MAISRKSRLYKVLSLHHIPALMTPLFAAADWLSISINLLLVIHVIVCILLALVVLMQRPKQEGLGAAFGAGLTDQAFGARTTDVLQKGTVYLSTLFFVITLVLAILIGKRQSDNPTLTNLEDDKKPEIEAVDTPDISDEPISMPDVPEIPSEPTPAEVPTPEIPAEVETPVLPETPVTPEVPKAPVTE